MLAIMSNLDNNLILFLINKGADMLMVDNEGLTPLMLACISGNYGIVNILATEHTINLKTNYGYTALMYAAMKSYDYQKDYKMNKIYTDIVSMLLKRGALFDPNEEILKHDFKCTKIINMIKKSVKAKVSMDYNKKRLIAIKDKKNSLIAEFMNELNKQSRINNESKYIILTMELISDDGKFHFNNIDMVLKELKGFHAHKSKIYNRYKCSFLPKDRMKRMEKIASIAELIRQLTVIASYRNF